MSNFKVMSISLSLGLTLLSHYLYGRYPTDSEFQNSEYRVHQVSLKNSDSQNFSFLTFRGGCWRDTNFFLQWQRRVTDGTKLIAQIMLCGHEKP
jgi:hypothetical protein